MLTRAGVARRLGKCVATVRRLEEAGELTPGVNWRGVHIFDEDEVEELRERFAEEGSIPAAHSAWFDSDRAGAFGSSGPNVARHDASAPSEAALLNHDEVAKLRRENAQLRGRIAVARDAVEIWRDGRPISDVLELLEAVLSDG